MRIALDMVGRLGTLAGSWRSALAALRRCRASGLMVCRASAGRVYGAYLDRSNGRSERRSFVFCCPRAAQEELKRLACGCRIIALLPKPHYLIKSLQIPTVSADEVASMLALEVEALLPAEYGPAEVSYRVLATQGQTHLIREYELYVARRDELTWYLSELEDFGIRPDLILPSAVAWGRILESADGLGMLVVGSDRDGLREAASVQPHGALSVRVLNGTADGSASGTIDQALMEVIRSSLARACFQDNPLVVGWADGQVPAGSTDGKVVFRSLGDLLPGIHQEARASQDGEALVSLAATALSEAVDAPVLDRANLLPRALQQDRSWKAILRRMAIGAAAMVLGLLLVYASLKLLIVRYRLIGGELAAEIAVIGTEGEAVGRRIQQLHAVNVAIATQGRFFDLIAGLYDATPEGVTYSNVELTAVGDIRLAGQAESIAMPFLLPQRLEAQKCFQDVSLRDAAQVKRTGGSIVEFRIDGRLAGSEGEP